jgi:hypothetical protein
LPFNGISKTPQPDYAAMVAEGSAKAMLNKDGSALLTLPPHIDQAEILTVRQLALQKQ